MDSVKISCNSEVASKVYFECMLSEALEWLDANGFIENKDYFYKLINDVQYDYWSPHGT